MSIISLVGIDPGLVHSGVVGIELNTEKKIVIIDHRIVEGDNVKLISRIAAGFAEHGGESHIFIEKYIDRATAFATHGKMRVMEADLKNALTAAKLIDNTGVKKVVTPKLMKLLDVWDFPMTNHRDLQAAARIALYGALKDDRLNTILAKIVMDHLDGSPWLVAKRI